MAVTTEDVAFTVRVIAETVIANESEFGELDAVVGDGDFGYSMARGFEAVVDGWSDIPRATVGEFLKRVAVLLSARMGGTSGPIWGTAFLRAGVSAGERAEIDGSGIVSMFRAAVEGIHQRGNAVIGDKTLLDALVPAIDAIEEATKRGAPSAEVFSLAASVANDAAEGTRAMQARRGRAAYAGERSIGSPDAGAVAVAEILGAVARAWQERLQG